MKCACETPENTWGYSKPVFCLLLTEPVGDYCSANEANAEVKIQIVKIYLEISNHHHLFHLSSGLACDDFIIFLFNWLTENFFCSSKLRESHTNHGLVAWLFKKINDRVIRSQLFFSVLGKILEFKGYAVGLKPAFDSVAEMMCVDGASALSSEPILAYKTLLRLFCKLHHESLGHSDYSQLTNMLSTEKILQ